MRFYSTRNKLLDADWQTVLMKGLPDDEGLYMPESIVPLPSDFWEKLPHLSFPDLAFEVAKCLLQDALPDDDLRQIIDSAINFEAPVHDVCEGMACLELFHGPSFAFKDFGARFMAQMMSYFKARDTESTRKLHILVATSGDTGGAVAQGFLGTANIEVIILYPSQKVSHLQEQQLTALGSNIHALEIKGTFDDCQAMVKKAFSDAALREQISLSSANSINLARLIPQAFYYVRAYQQVMQRGKKVVFCVPSGNFGNLCAGLLAKKIGLPVTKFIAANNANNTFTEYLTTSNLRPRPSVETLSNAMDVGRPNNLERIQDLYDHNLAKMRQDIAAYSFSDDETLAAIQHVNDTFQYIICPHTAVAWLGLTTYFEQFPEERADTQGIFLGTAHPAKFADKVEEKLNITVPIPDRLKALLDLAKDAIPMEADYEHLKQYLLGKI